jgi:hypothetical protein
MIIEQADRCGSVVILTQVRGSVRIPSAILVIRRLYKEKLERVTSSALT